MRPDDRPIRRTLRQKRLRTHRDDGLDFGAVSVGLIACITAILVTIAGPLPNWIRYGIIITSIIVGCLAAGMLTISSPRFAMIHGIIVSLTTALLLTAVGISMLVGDGPIERVVVFSIVGTTSDIGIIAITAGLVTVGGICGLIGYRLRNRRYAPFLSFLP